MFNAKTVEELQKQYVEYQDKIVKDYRKGLISLEEKDNLNRQSWFDYLEVCYQLTGDLRYVSSYCNYMVQRLYDKLIDKNPSDKKKELFFEKKIDVLFSNFEKHLKHKDMIPKTFDYNFRKKWYDPVREKYKQNITGCVGMSEYSNYLDKILILCQQYHSKKIGTK